MAQRVIAVVLIVGSLVSAPSVSFGGQAEPKRYAGRAVVDVLSELQATKLKIIFSTELVPPSLRVDQRAARDRTREIALQILEPHGLTLQQGPGGTLLVVARGARQAGESRSPRPQSDDAAAVAAPDPMSRLIAIAEHVEVIDRLGRRAGRARASMRSSRQAVREMAGGLENVLQAVQVLPGVAGTNDEEGKLAVRGAGPEHNMIVLDGVQIHNAQRFGEFTTSFLNPATASSVALDASGLDARYRRPAVVGRQPRDARRHDGSRAWPRPGRSALTSGDVLLEGRMPRHRRRARGGPRPAAPTIALVADRFSDGAMPSFGDVQFKTTLYPTKRTRLTFFGLAGREMLSEVRAATPAARRSSTASNEGENRIAAGDAALDAELALQQRDDRVGILDRRSVRGSASCRRSVRFRRLRSPHRRAGRRGAAAAAVRLIKGLH